MPSTSFGVSMPEGVDARDERGHDGVTGFKSRGACTKLAEQPAAVKNILPYIYLTY